MGTIVNVIINRNATLKAILFVGLFIICFFASLVLWPAIIFRTLENIQIRDLWITIQSKSLTRLLFGPVTPFAWEIKQLLKCIGNYGFFGVSVWFRSVSFIHIIGGPLYLYAFYCTVKSYIFSHTEWHNWKIIILMILFALTWFFWGESYIAFGV
jgi:hypothetical protein